MWWAFFGREDVVPMLGSHDANTTSSATSLFFFSYGNLRTVKIFLTPCGGQSNSTSPHEAPLVATPASPSPTVVITSRLEYRCPFAPLIFGLAPGAPPAAGPPVAIGAAWCTTCGRYTASTGGIHSSIPKGRYSYSRSAESSPAEAFLFWYCFVLLERVLGTEARL